MFAISVFQFSFVKLKLLYAYSDKLEYELVLQIKDLLIYGQIQLLVVENFHQITNRYPCQPHLFEVKTILGSLVLSESIQLLLTF